MNAHLTSDPPLMVQQHHDQEHEDERAHHVQHCGPHGRGTGHLIGVCEGAEKWIVLAS